MYDPLMIGAIKIKDGLFIGDELASQVSIRFIFVFDMIIFYNNKCLLIYNIGSRVCGC